MSSLNHTDWERRKNCLDNDSILRIFKALGHHHRMRIYKTLLASENPLTMSDLQKKLPRKLSYTNIRIHVQKLIDAGLIAAGDGCTHEQNKKPLIVNRSIIPDVIEFFEKNCS